MTIEQAINKVVLYATEEIGTREGPDNQNKYAAMPEMTQLLGWDAQHQPWCNIFVNAVFIQCFGLETGAAMLYQPIGGGSALCRASADFFKAAGAWIKSGRTPEPGDVIFFYRSGDINHMGIVTRIAGGSVITVEGNSSDMVAERCYSVSDNSIAGYGRPNWALVEGMDIDAPATATDKPKEPAQDAQRFYELRFPYLSKGDKGYAVWVVQTLLQARNVYCGPWGADSDFGSDTEKGVRDFQRREGLSADGVVGPETGAALFGGEIVKDTNTYGLGAQIAQKIRGGD